MHIRPGAILQADGGYLIINAIDTLIESGVWNHLKRVLKYKKLESGFVIYSIGEDLSDDGGREIPESSKQRSNSTWDITFIIEK